MNTFILDFETTGLSPYLNDVIEIAIKKYGEDGNFHQSLVKPKKMPNGSLYTFVPPDIVKLTGITDTMINENGILTTVATYLMFKYILDNSDLEKPIYIVSHNGTTFAFIFFKRLECEYIEKKGMGINIDIFNNIKYIDTILIAKSFPTYKRFSQKHLCEKYKIVNDSEHRALGDILALEKLYTFLCKDYSKYMKKEENYYLENPQNFKLYN